MRTKTQMTNRQKSFLKFLLKTVDQAQDTRDAILEAVAIGVGDPAGNMEYARALETYIEAGRRMALQCTVAYSKGSDRIAMDAIVNQNEN